VIFNQAAKNFFQLPKWVWLSARYISLLGLPSFFHKEHTFYVFCSFKGVFYLILVTAVGDRPKAQVWFLPGRLKWTLLPKQRYGALPSVRRSNLYSLTFRRTPPLSCCSRTRCCLCCFVRVPTPCWKYWIVKSVFKTLKKYWIYPKCTEIIEKVWKFQIKPFVYSNFVLYRWWQSCRCVFALCSINKILEKRR